MIFCLSFDHFPRHLKPLKMSELTVTWLHPQFVTICDICVTRSHFWLFSGPNSIAFIEFQKSKSAFCLIRDESNTFCIFFFQNFETMRFRIAEKQCVFELKLVKHNQIGVKKSKRIPVLFQGSFGSTKRLMRWVFDVEFSLKKSSPHYEGARSTPLK